MIIYLKVLVATSLVSWPAGLMLAAVTKNIPPKYSTGDCMKAATGLMILADALAIGATMWARLLFL